MADTDIELAIDLNTTDAEKTAKDLQKEIEGIFESRKGEQSSSLTNLELQMKKNYDTAERLREKLKELGQDTPTAEYTQVLEDMRQAEIRQRELTEELAKMPDLKETFDYYKQIQSAIEQLKESGKEVLYDPTGILGQVGDTWTLQDLEDTKNETKEVMDMIMPLKEELDGVNDTLSQLNLTKEQLEATNSAVIVGTETEEYQKLQAQLDLTNDKLKQQIIHYQELTEKQAAANSEMAVAKQEMANGNKSVTALSMSLRAIGRMIPGISTTGIMSITMLTKGVMRLTNLTKVQLVQALAAVKAAFAKLFAFIISHPIILVLAAITAAVVAIIKVFKKWKAEGEEVADILAEKVLETLEKAKDIAKDLISTLVKGFIRIGTLLPRAALNFVQFLVNKLKSLKSTIEESLKLMATWNNGMNETNTALSNLTSSLNYLKGAIGAAFAPILTTVEPILTSLMDSLADIINFVGMIIAKLSGATTFTKAIRVQTDYAKSLDKTAKSAKNAQGQLASFDKLNVLNNSDKSSGLDKAVVDFAKIDLEDTPLPDWILDFEKLGTTISESINNFLKRIDWDYIKNKASMVGTDIADFINNLDFGEALGKTFGEGINTITTAVNSFLKKFKGLNFGKKLGKLLKKAIETIDWKGFGEMFSNGINQLSLTIIGFTDEFEGSELASAFTQFLTGSLGNIDWVLVRAAIRGIVDDIVGFLNGLLTEENFKLVGTTLGELLNTIFTGINVFADGAKWTEWGENLAKGIEEFVEKTDFTMGAQAIHKVFMGLLNLIGSAVTELMKPENIQKITDSIVEFIKNLKFEEIGKKAKEISDKLITGLKQIWQALKDSGALKEIIKMIVDLLQSKKDWEDMFKDFKTDIAKEVLKAKLNEIFGPVIDGLKSVLGELVDGFKYVWDQILDLFGLNEEMGYVSGAGNIKKFRVSGIRERIKTKVPGMAEGAVLPPNKPFLAMVGDQTNGTNIEAPLSTIQQAVADVMSGMGIKVVFDVKGDPNGLFKAVQKKAEVYSLQHHGKSAF